MIRISVLYRWWCNTRRVMNSSYIQLCRCVYGNGTGRNGNSTLRNPMGMGMSQKVGNRTVGMGIEEMGMGGNGNVKSHSGTSLLSSCTIVGRQYHWTSIRVLSNCQEWDKWVLNELKHSRQRLNRHLFHAGRRSVVWSTLSLVSSRMTAPVGYQHAIPLQTVW